MKKFKIYFWKNMPNELFKDLKEKYKDRQKDYMRVYFCSDFNEMYRLGDKLDKQWEQESDPHNYGARTFCHDKCYVNEDKEIIGVAPQCGEMIFNDEWFTNNCIAHECTHAVLGYISRKLKEHKDVFDEIEDYKLIKDNTYNEELVCYMVGNLVEQICHEATKE